MAAYFPIMMSPLVLNWLEALPASSINSWQDMCTAFIQYFQASCQGPKTRWDLGSYRISYPASPPGVRPMVDL
jgi:hypothetical protein